MLYNETGSLKKDVAIALAERHDLFASTIAGRHRTYTNFHIYGSLKVELDFEVEDEKKKTKQKKQSQDASDVRH